MTIDFHCHTFPERISEKVVKKLGGVAHMKPQTKGSMSDLLASMKNNKIDYSVNLPVMTSADQVEKINSGFIKDKDELLNKGIVSFGGLHVEYEDYKKEILRLKNAGIKGIKLHPPYQGVDLDDIRILRMIDAISEQGLITIIHAGIDIGIYDHNYASIPHILKIIREVAPEKFVLAHMGNWGCWDEVEKDLCGAPVWFDSACSIGEIFMDEEDETLPLRTYNLDNDQFVRISRKHGTDKILFATDSPWADQGIYVDRLKAMAFTKEEQQQILYDNAAALLDLTK